MRVKSRLLAAAAAILLLSSSVAACGGGGHAKSTTSSTTASVSSGEFVGKGKVVLKVGDTPVTSGTVAHWTATIAGGDFFEISGFSVPKGLVSTPEDNAACVAAIRSIAASDTSPPPTGQLQKKCQQFNKAVRKQAASYLISAYVNVGMGAENGISVTRAEIQKAFRQLQAHEFPTEAELARYLKQREWSLSDELFLVKRNLISEELTTKLKAQYAHSGGETALVNYVNGISTRWLAKTSCQPEYVANGCPQYATSKSVSELSPAVLIEEILKLAHRQRTSNTG